MAVARITQIIGASPHSWEDAVRNALERANKTLRGITGIEVIKENAAVENGKIAEYRAPGRRRPARQAREPALRAAARPPPAALGGAPDRRVPGRSQRALREGPPLHDRRGERRAAARRDVRPEPESGAATAAGRSQGGAAPAVAGRPARAGRARYAPRERRRGTRAARARSPAAARPRRARRGGRRGARARTDPAPPAAANALQRSRRDAPAGRVDDVLAERGEGHQEPARRHGERRCADDDQRGAACLPRGARTESRAHGAAGHVSRQRAHAARAPEAREPCVDDGRAAAR